MSVYIFSIVSGAITSLATACATQEPGEMISFQACVTLHRAGCGICTYLVILGSIEYYYKIN